MCNEGDLLREGLPNKDLEGVKVVSNESLNNQSFQKFVSFSEFLGLSMEGFEKEVESLLRKPEVRKGRKVVRGFLSGCRVRGWEGEGVQVTHLAFADDTMVFCEASIEQMVFLSWILMWFEAILGLKINLHKSEILLVGRVENVEELALELGCKVGALPSSFLGLPLGVAHKSAMVWDGVEERFQKRLVMWKRQFISKEGRITLIQSTLSSMPIYFMSLLRMPQVVRLRLEKI